MICSLRQTRVVSIRIELVTNSDQDAQHELDCIKTLITRGTRHWAIPPKFFPHWWFTAEPMIKPCNKASQGFVRERNK